MWTHVPKQQYDRNPWKSVIGFSSPADDRDEAQKGWLTRPRSHSLDAAVQHPKWFQELVKTGSPNPPGRTLCPALLVGFIHSPKVTETKNVTGQRERRGQASDLYFQFSLAGSCSQGCWANTWLLRFPCEGSSWWPSEPWRFAWGWSAASGRWAHMSQKGWLSTLNLVVL